MELENPRWEKFAQEYAKGASGAEAYVSAGYKAKDVYTASANANRLLKKDKVADRVSELQKEAASSAVADAREIREFLTSVMRGETDEEQIVVVGSGNGFSEAVKRKKAPSHADRMKAADMLNKMGGNYNNDATITVITPQFTGDDELED